MELFMFGIFAVVLAFTAIVLRTILRWKDAWRWVAVLPLVVLALAILNIVLDPNSHNLWPFELIVWVVFGFIILGVVAAARSQFIKRE